MRDVPRRAVVPTDGGHVRPRPAEARRRRFRVRPFRPAGHPGWMHTDLRDDQLQAGWSGLGLHHRVRLHEFHHGAVTGHDPRRHARRHPAVRRPRGGGPHDLLLLRRVPDPPVPGWWDEPPLPVRPRDPGRGARHRRQWRLPRLEPGGCRKRLRLPRHHLSRPPDASQWRSRFDVDAGSHHGGHRSDDDGDVHLDHRHLVATDGLGRRAPTPSRSTGAHR